MNLDAMTGKRTMRIDPRTWAAAAISAVALGCLPAAAQHVYGSPQAAADAFTEAIATSDETALRTVLGNDWRRFVPAGEVDREDIYTFLEAWSRKHSVVPAGEGRMLLAAGEGNWTMAVPIVKVAGGWRFDPRAGADVMKTRRIGRNELSAMQAVLAYVDAQREYSRIDRDGNGVLEYAQKFASSPGKHDGLYWPEEPGQPLSPIGPAFAPVQPGEGYHGYRFKILKAQGPGADGGARSYLIGSRMRSGFALVAWPVRYGETGVMSFIVNQDGGVYEKDLGSGTDAAARAMTLFDPSGGWRKAQVPDQ